MLHESLSISQVAPPARRDAGVNLQWDILSSEQSCLNILRNFWGVLGHKKLFGSLQQLVHQDSQLTASTLRMIANWCLPICLAFLGCWTRTEANNDPKEMLLGSPTSCFCSRKSSPGFKSPKNPASTSEENFHHNLSQLPFSPLNPCMFARQTKATKRDIGRGAR